MTNVIAFEIPGKPVPWSAAHVTGKKRYNKEGKLVPGGFSKKRKREYQKKVKTCAAFAGKPRWEFPVKLLIEVYDDGKADLTNIQKNIEDAIQNIIIANDKWVRDVRTVWYPEYNKREMKAVVTVTPLEELCQAKRT